MSLQDSTVRKITTALEKESLTQADLSRRMGRSPQWLWYNLKAKMSLPSLEAIATELGCRVEIKLIKERDIAF